MPDTASSAVLPPVGAPALRSLYLGRFVFALVWAALLVLTAPASGPVLIALLVIYPLVDAGAVLWQLRRATGTGSRAPEIVNVALSVAAAIALGIAATIGAPPALLVWGVWAILSGLAQLLAAVARRRQVGQVPLIVSGAISVLAGIAFAGQGAMGGSGIAGIGGYALFGGVLFLIAAIRLTVLARRGR